jgi:acetyl-CoA carboxylase biotin carboxyl carrier protein
VRIGGRRSPLAPDPDLIRSLAKLLDETGLTEIEYAVGDQRIHVARNAAAPAVAGSPQPVASEKPPAAPPAIPGPTVTNSPVP